MGLFRSPIYALFFTAFALLTLGSVALAIWGIAFVSGWYALYFLLAAFTGLFAVDVVNDYRRYRP